MDSLCYACQDMFNGRSRNVRALSGKRENIWKDRFEHHLSPWMLEKAAQDGCYICTTIWEALLPIEQEKLRRTSKSKSKLLIRTKQFLQCTCNHYLILYENVENYTWHCDPHPSQLVFSFGRTNSWKEVKFDLIHSQGSVEHLSMSWLC